MNSRAYFILLGLLAILFLFPLAEPFSFSIDNNQQILKAVPHQLGPWKGKDISLDERTYEILETRNVLSRDYQNSEGKSVHLLIVASHKDRRVAHPPEVCYLSSHYTILDERKEEWKWNDAAITLKGFTAKDKKNPAHQEKVWYVYKVGDRYTSNYFAQQLLFAWDRVTRRESQILLIRVAGLDESPFKEFLSRILAVLS